jgi:hypothetical protein
MGYQLIANPIAVQFDRMEKKELRDYYDSFLRSIPERIMELYSAIRDSPGCEDWKPDYSPSSLGPLGDWFASQVKTRPRTEEEIKKIQSGSPYPIEVPLFALNDRTLSLAFDVGMYLSEVLLHNHSSIRWNVPLGSKRDIDYGQPVLVGFVGSVPFNPVRIATVLAQGIADGDRSGKRLRELYDIWSKKLVQRAS